MPKYFDVFYSRSPSHSIREILIKWTNLNQKVFYKYKSRLNKSQDNGTFITKQVQSWIDFLIVFLSIPFMLRC